MPRVKRGVTARARHKKVFKQTKGFRGRRKIGQRPRDDGVEGQCARLALT